MLQTVQLDALDGPQAQALLMQLAKYPAMLQDAALGLAPHDVAFICVSWLPVTTVTMMPNVYWLTTSPLNWHGWRW